MDEPAAAADYIQGLLGENDDGNEDLQQAIIEGLATLEGCEVFALEGLRAGAGSSRRLQRVVERIRNRSSLNANSIATSFTAARDVICREWDVPRGARRLRSVGRAMEAAAADDSVMEVPVEEDDSSSS